MISKFFIDRPVLSNVLAIVIVLLGAIALFRLPVQQYPDIAPPTVQVTTSYPGASAETVAETVALPLEQAINGVEGMIYMQSTSASNGTYALTVTFAIGTNLDLAQVLVQNRVATAAPLLPSAVAALGVTVQKTSTAILQIATLNSPDERFDGLFLSNYATINLMPELQRLSGVGNVVVFGTGLYSMRIWMDPRKLYTYGLVPQDVITAIQNQNQQVSAGQIGMPPAPADQNFQYNIRMLGRLNTVEQFSDIIVKADPGDGGRLVRISDVARVELGSQSYAQQFHVDGKPAAGIAIYQTPDANALEVAARVRAKLAEMSHSFPQGMTWGLPFDTTPYIQASVTEVYWTLAIAGILVLLVMMLFLQDWRVVLVPASTIPVTIIGAFAAISALGYTINLSTLFAIVLAIGIVVDDAIVIVEAVVRRIEQGLPRHQAAIEAMTELTGPIIGITLVLMSVFIPASFLAGVTGRMFAQFALVIAATALLSALNAATLKPTQCALWLRASTPRDQRNIVFRGFNRAYDGLERGYARLVHSLTRHNVIAAIAAVALAGLGAWGLSQVHTGFIPAEDQGYVLIAIQLPDGAALGRTEKTLQQATKMALDTPGVAKVVSVAGMSMLDGGAALANAGVIFVTLKPWGERGRARGQDLASITMHLQGGLFTIPDGQAFVVPPPAVPGVGNAGGLALQVELRDGSFDFTKLQRVTDELIRNGSAQSGLGQLITTFRAGAPQVELDVDRTKAKALGVSVGDVFATLGTYLGSAYVNQFTKFGLNLQVYVQADTQYRHDAKEILDLRVRNAAGEMVPIGSVAELKSSLGPPLIGLYNRFPTASVIGSPEPGFSTGEAMDILTEAARRTLPAGMGIEWTGMSYQEQQARGQVVLIFGLAIALVYLCLAGLFESWLAPLAVILSVPLAVIGPYITLEALALSNNLYTQIGLLLLIALSAKNAILIVMVAREVRARGTAIVDAAIEAALNRFRPILMTSLTMVLSVVPLVLATGAGANARHDLGLCVFSGMIASTCLAVLFVPSFFCLLQRLEERLSGTPAGAAAPTANKGA
jgi:HAE1 family hydrophobic/amphiphilic exporter-1